MRRSLLAALATLGTMVGSAQGMGLDAPPAPYFRLQLTDTPGRGKCLEANAIGQHSVLGGATFLDRCQSVTGQMWTARKVAPGRFQLFAEFGGPERCLTVNTGEIASIPPRAPYMAACAASHAFEAIPGQGNNYFRLRTAIDGQPVCLGARVRSDIGSSFAPVFASPCEGRADQTWVAVEARLVEGVPVALSEEKRRVVALEAPFGVARPAECEWNDGTSDRSQFFACLFEEAPDGRRFVVTGSSLSHAFEVESGGSDVARGFLQAGSRTLPLGRFERHEDGDCWINRQSGEWLCVR